MVFFVSKSMVFPSLTQRVSVQRGYGGHGEGVNDGRDAAEASHERADL